MAFSDILIYGDPHGSFEPMAQAALDQRPGAIVIVGDLMLTEEGLELVRLARSVCPVYFIAGNHDSDKLSFWRHLGAPEMAPFNLHARCVEICGARVAGLSGVFRASVWDGRASPAPDQAHLNWSRWADDLFGESAERALELNRNRALSHLCTIWPKDYLDLAAQTADALITHEAPTCHPYGFAAIDQLAQSLGVKVAFHGHHHDRLDYSSRFAQLGFEAHGVGMRALSWGNGDALTHSVNESFQKRERKRSFGP